jgi:nicotinamide-nucleotide adenylyltransferase
MSKIALYLGRFQPFHLGHLDAVNQIINDGITKIIIGIGSSQEELTRANPFSYHERKEMIIRTLHELKIDFEIHAIPDFANNQDWIDYIAEELPFFDCIYSGNPFVQICFEEGKIDREFKTLDIISVVKGTIIRHEIENRTENWSSQLPSEVVKYITEIKGVERLQNIYDKSNNTQHIQNKPIGKILVVEKITRFEYLQRKNELENLENEKYQMIYNFDQEHSSVRKEVLQKLSDFGMEFQIVKEKNINNMDLDEYELIITLGGDGTFLNIAKKLRNQIIMGINSEPGQSVGHITKFNLQNLSRTLEHLKLGLYNIELWDRLSVSINGVRLPFLALNEILVAKLSIYQTSKLQINLDTLQGYCLGNGIIISTKMGSTAFYKSAGGASFDSPNFAYTMILPFQINGNIEQNRILSPNSQLKITPKRDDHYVIFDCDENRKVLLNDEDEVEIQKLDDNILRVLV